jgi:amidohydrolase
MSGWELTPLEREELVTARRDLHRHPELAFAETRTAGIVAGRLHELGFEVREGVGRTGVVGVLRCGQGPTLALRADMDALPIQEVVGREHGSCRDGVMHACGHDGHVATLLAALGVLARQRQQLGGTIMAVFQPAEEGGGGAKAMIADGALDDPRPDVMVGLHYWALRETGVLGVKSGAIMGSVDRFELVVRGRGGHAAIPQHAADALVTAAEVVTALQTVVSRRVDPIQPVVVTVGEFQAGTAFNVIPGEARLTGTVRTLDTEVWEAVPGLIESVARGVCEAHGCELELDYRRLDRPLVNDPGVTAQVRELAVAVAGEDNVVEEVTLGGEDMADFLERVPGCFFFVGARNEERGITASHHDPAFDIDEDALPLGAEMLIRVARRWLAPA